MNVTLPVTLLAYSLALWLGLYLLTQRQGKTPVRLAGLGLVTYALALASDLLAQAAPSFITANWLTRAHWWLVTLPALFWAGSLLHLLPESTPSRQFWLAAWRILALPVAALTAVAVFGGQAAIDLALGDDPSDWSYRVLAGVLSLLLLASVSLALLVYRRSQPHRPLGLALLATLFFSLGLGLLLFPLGIWPREWMVLALGADLVALGVSLAIWDAFDEGEAWLPHLARAFMAAAVPTLLFGGLVSGAALMSGMNFILLSLLLAVIAAAVAMQALADPLQTWLDRLVFARWPRLRQERAELRAVASALPRAEAQTSQSTAAPDPAELERLTRRALSRLGDLPALAASPLIQLPGIGRRLAERGAHDHAMERAAELKAVLLEGIAGLKPRTGEDFGFTDEWRHYNAVYYPYVLGWKPYSRRAESVDLDPAARQAWEWFRASVPERTLHNWQNGAARLIAASLRPLERE